MKRESDMTAPLLAWLEERGYVGYCEVPRYGASIDIVGWHRIDDSLIVVEMKRSLSQTVARQAMLLQPVTWQAYCAVLSKPRQTGLNLCRRYGLGVLRVHPATEVVSRLLSPCQRFAPGIPAANRLRERLKGLEPGGLAGVANLAGHGPAQECERAIESYRADHPSASWQEVYENVPNHYAHARSMQSAMRMVRERRAWRQQRPDERPAVAERVET